MRSQTPTLGPGRPAPAASIDPSSFQPPFVQTPLLSSELWTFSLLHVRLEHVHTSRTFWPDARTSAHVEPLIPIIPLPSGLHLIFVCSEVDLSWDESLKKKARKLLLAALAALASCCRFSLGRLATKNSGSFDLRALLRWNLNCEPISTKRFSHLTCRCLLPGGTLLQVPVVRGNRHSC